MIVLLLALALVLGLVACGGGSNTTECAACHKTAKCKSISHNGQTGWYCDNCYDNMKTMVDLLEQYGG